MKIGNKVCCDRCSRIGKVGVELYVECVEVKGKSYVYCVGKCKVLYYCCMCRINKEESEWKKREMYCIVCEDSLRRLKSVSVTWFQ